MWEFGFFIYLDCVGVFEVIVGLESSFEFVLSVVGDYEKVIILVIFDFCFIFYCDLDFVVG